MKRLTVQIMFSMIWLLMAGTAVFAQGPMGPPEQMKECNFLEGTWTADTQWKMSDSTDWIHSKATCEYTMILGGAALQMVYKSEMMGMPFEGLSIQTYDREIGKWQTTWTDNMSGRTSLYTGEKTEGKTVMMGEDIYQGHSYLARMTSYNETPTSFDWSMEQSMDGGKTWFMSGKAHYTKQ